MATSSRLRVADKYDLHKNVQHLSEVFRRWIAPESGASSAP
jgi:hypothetical protein